MHLNENGRGESIKSKHLLEIIFVMVLVFCLLWCWCFDVSKGNGKAKRASQIVKVTNSNHTKC